MMNSLVLVFLVCFVSSIQSSMMSVQHAKNYNNKRADELRYTVFQAIRGFDKAKFSVAFSEYAALSDQYADMYKWAASRKDKTDSEHFTVKNYQKIQANEIKNRLLMGGGLMIATVSVLKFYDNFIAKESMFDFSAYNFMKALLAGGLVISASYFPYFYNFVRADLVVKERKEATEYFEKTIRQRMEETLAAKGLWHRSEQRHIYFRRSFDGGNNDSYSDED